MSDVLWAALISGILALLGVVLGLGYSEYRKRQERRERFQVMSFEKRLQVHQEALSRIYKLSDDIYKRTLSDDVKRETIDNVKNWWVGNQLLLDENSRRHILALIDISYDHVFDSKVRPSRFSKAWRETREAIYQGIGTEHLSDTKYEEKLEGLYEQN